ncbi:SIR2 family protein [Bombella sp. TMW 2.2559]|uniref:SIR2 family protein n=1 Tax=Bombella dulcis TaxID=2967339 RepID=A0ABT3WAE6_9PROT|nr:SIR2 family protein [Bombella dulcis]MCX5615603.1 SIR2 family protein [Bombella dulcis]
MNLQVGGQKLRFLANGPSIPDELLMARDEGHVVFFCGAGVSRAFAGLPDFFGLADKIIDKLRVEPDSPACKLIQDARTSVPGAISIDRIFGLLEREFASSDIEEAVTSALKPPENCVLTAHKILLDLASTPQGTKLVTTNFDRLFDDCGRNLQSWQPPRLPDPLRSNEFNGIVYLHGRAKPDYGGAEGDGFVLSSSTFGHAYVSNGWATAFIRSILEQYLVVFVGYTADDAPVQYLLEALNTANRKKAFAFHAGNQKEAAARWRHKGVNAIPYDAPDNDHTALWDSLKAWAKRARDPEAWYEEIIATSQKGPAKLQPHERGQIAHIVSTHKGAEKFRLHEPPPPAEWLCVFDRYRRFAAPGNTDWLNPAKSYVNPFERYGLDSDPLPPSEHSPKQQPPSGAWDALEPNTLDVSTSSKDNLTAFHTQNPYYTPRLVSRLEQLGLWLARVCDQPAAIWWAVRQTFLHQNIQYYILQRFNTPDSQIHDNTRIAWRLLFENWEQPKNFYHDWFTLQSTIRKEGWSSSLIRKFGALLQPYLSIEPSPLDSPIPPNADTPQGHDRLIIRKGVTHPQPYKPITIPDEWCLPAVRILRQNLELALALEHEAGGYTYTKLAHYSETM